MQQATNYHTLFNFYLEHNKMQEQSPLMFALSADRVKKWAQNNQPAINRMLKTRNELYEKYCVEKEDKSGYQSTEINGKTVLTLKEETLRDEFNTEFEKWANTTVNINY